MSLNSVVSAERVQIGFFGMRNAGKSSLVNAVTSQRLSLVSDVKGTTTDPVRKAMELLPLGPVVIIDTPGLDDEGDLGRMRVERARELLDSVDIAILVVDALKGMSHEDKELLRVLDEKSIRHITVYNKADLLGSVPQAAEGEIYVSSLEGKGIDELKEMLAKTVKAEKKQKKLLEGLVSEGDTVILVMPIDESAPKGRIILPQQQCIRELLEMGATTICVQPEGLAAAIEKLKKAPEIVITDSQAFRQVYEITGENIPLTSFSILFARYKGELVPFLEGISALKKIKDGDRILISEGCTHHRQCNDIGTVKLPGWIKKYTGKDIAFSFTSGGEFPSDLSEFSLVVHCGGCMLTEKEMKARMEKCLKAGVPITNYGITIAEIHGILSKSVEPFRDIAYEKN